MAIKEYVEHGQSYWRVYVHLRSKLNDKIRLQKAKTKILSLEKAIEEERELIRWMSREIARRENEGLSWEEVLEAWELWYQRFPSQRWDKSTVRDYISLCRNWTKPWLKRPAKMISVSDAYSLLEYAKEDGASTQLLYQIKTTVNVIYKWAMSVGKIVGKDHSPFFGIELKKKGEDSVPEILTRQELSHLLKRAEESAHEWFPIWLVDAHTGLRAGELEGLRKEDIKLVSEEEARELDQSFAAVKSYGAIRVQRQWRKKLKGYGPLKGRYWRTVPISSELFWFLNSYLKNDFGSDDQGARVFPEIAQLKSGQQAVILRNFCRANGLKSIKFHTLRACFATLLLESGVSESKVMKIGGWKDRETMMIYIRLAGIDEAGATEVLDFGFKPVSNVQPPRPSSSNVVSLFSASAALKSDR